jgi:hypothetical protein
MAEVGGLDAFLNFAIPIVIFIAIIAFVYFKAKKPIDTLFGKIKDILSNSFGNKENDSSKGYSSWSDNKIEYRSDYY